LTLLNRLIAGLPDCLVACLRRPRPAIYLNWGWIVIQ